jgi:hypothetical protein
VNAFERRVRAAVYATLRDEAAAPSVARLERNRPAALQAEGVVIVPLDR